MVYFDYSGSGRTHLQPKSQPIVSIGYNIYTIGIINSVEILITSGTNLFYRPTPSMSISTYARKIRLQIPSSSIGFEAWIRDEIGHKLNREILYTVSIIPLLALSLYLLMTSKRPHPNHSLA